MGNWDERYRDTECFHGLEPSRFLADYVWLWNAKPGNVSLDKICCDVTTRRHALDIAMGEGRNAIFLAQQGFSVTGVEQSHIAVDRCRKRASALNLHVETIESDLLIWEFPESCYDLIICVNYLEQSLFPKIKRALKPGGWLVYETLTKEHLKYYTINPDYVLNNGELLKAFSSLRFVVYRETDLTYKKKAVASLIAQKEA